MEEYDDLTAGPHDDGSLNLSYNDYEDMPHELFDLFYDRLLHLNLSYNGLTKISKNIQKLVLLKELNLSHNQIDFIDPAISCCVRLRRLNVSCNNLTTLPAELSHCRLLVSFGCV